MDDLYRSYGKLRLVGCGSEAGSRMICCQRCTVGVDESLANGKKVASLAYEELSLNVAYTKEKQVMTGHICKPQARIELVNSRNDDGVVLAGLDKDNKDSGSKHTRRWYLGLRRGAKYGESKSGVNGTE